MEEREKEIARIKADFPIFKSADFFYLDNAATTQKPYCVMDMMKQYYETENANPLRGLYELSLMRERGLPCRTFCMLQVPRRLSLCEMRRRA